MRLNMKALCGAYLEGSTEKEVNRKESVLVILSRSSEWRNQVVRRETISCKLFQKY